MTGLLVSDFNINTLARYLTNDGGDPRVEVHVAPHGQVMQVLSNGEEPCWECRPDFCFVWTRPEAILSTFGSLLRSSDPNLHELDREVDEFAASLIASSKWVKMLFVALWIIPPFHQGWGLGDLDPRSGIMRALMRANTRLLSSLDGALNVFPLAAEAWLHIAGTRAFNSRLWYLGKIPFANEVFAEASRGIKAAMRGINGQARKLVILDLDNTLWGGIVGEDGSSGLVLGGHDPSGEALVDFQRELKSLTKRGVILAIVSKNEESIALDAIEHHPEMILRLDDFAGWRINWRDKAENIVELVNELQLQLGATVFIDDSPMERDRVRKALPDVLVPEWPNDKRLYAEALLHLDCFSKPRISIEDRLRPRMYVAERRRSRLRQAVHSIDDWRRSLSIAVQVERLDEINLPRAAQLLNKTNQLNLTSRRLTEAEISEWISDERRVFWTFRVSDKFGESGLTGLLSLEWEGRQATIVDFVLSCRVIGRCIEETMLHIAVLWARGKTLETVRAVYTPTPKNKPCLDFFRRSGFLEESLNSFVWTTTDGYPASPHVQIDFSRCLVPDETGCLLV